MSHQKFSLRARLVSFTHAIRGLKVVVSTQHNARIHVAAACLATVAGAFFEISSHEWCLIVLSIAAVFSAEAFNSALEFLTDLTSPEFHPMAGHAKDAAAGAVLVAAVGATIVGGIVFVPHVHAWLLSIKFS